MNDELPDSVISLDPPGWWQKGRSLEASAEEVQTFLQQMPGRRKSVEAAEAVEPAGAAAAAEPMVQDDGAESGGGASSGGADPRPKKTYKKIPPEVKLWFMDYRRMQKDLYGWDPARSLRQAKLVCPEWFEHVHPDAPKNWKVAPVFLRF